MNKISIIVPVFNTNPKLLQLCFESIFNQNFTDYELIVVDASDNKETKKCLLYLLNKHHFILLNCVKNVSAQRNLGIDTSSGKYILFLDSDDHISENFLDNLVHYLEENKNDVASPVIYREQINKKILMPHNFPSSYINTNNFFINALTSGIAHPIKLYKKELIGETRFDANLAFGEDMIFNYELAKKGFKYGVDEKSFYFYYAPPGENAAKKRLNKKSLNVLNVLNKISLTNCNELNLEGIYAEYDYIFYLFFYASANRFNVILLMQLCKYKWRYFKRHRTFKTFLFLTFPIIYTILRRSFKSAK